MRILRNLLLMVVPVLILINLYRFVSYNELYTFRGFSYLHQYFSTFNGLNNTFEVLDKLSKIHEVAQSVEVVDLETFFVAFGNYVKLVFVALSVPIYIVVDVVTDILWVLRMFANI